MIWSESFGPWKRIWKSWVPHKCCLFMLLVAPAHNMCWIANRLARSGLPHPEDLPLRDQHEETLNQLLTSSLFTRTFWFNLLQIVGLQALSLQPNECFQRLVGKAETGVDVHIRKG